MYLYTEENEKIKFITSKRNRLGTETKGNVFKISPDTCIKINKSADGLDLETLMLLKSLNLDNFYEIYDFFYTYDKKIKAYTMRYYENREIDILTEETHYTINNLSTLLSTVNILINNNILISDTHLENVILDKEKITIIDADLYRINRFFQKQSLEFHNLDSLRSLFESLYIYALKNYHSEIYNEFTLGKIKSLFKLCNQSQVHNTLNTLSQYKYPIDYVRSKVR